MSRGFSLLAAFTFAFISMQAQTPVPNGAFEDWSVTNPPVPTGWDTYDNFFYLNAQVNPDSLRLCSKETAAANVYAGSAACRLKTDSVYGFKINPGLLASNVIGLQGDSIVFTGWPFTDKPLSLNGALKYVPSGIDTGTLSLYLTRWDATNKTEIQVGHLDLYIWPTGGIYLGFSDTIIYDTTNLAPDTLVILIASSYHTSAAKVGSTLWVDDLSFTYSATGIVHFSMDDAVKVYPNPVSSILNISVDNYMAGYKFSVYDISGRLVKDYRLENANYSIDLSAYADGVYMYKVYDKQDKPVYQNKFVVTK